jgi:very-short-patch-repair endonuclease
MDLDTALARAGGAVSRDLLRHLGVSLPVLDAARRRGEVVRLFPRAYCRPWDVEEAAIRERAAVYSVGAPVALSHLTVLRRHGLITTPTDVHLSVPARRNPRPCPGVVVHRVGSPPPRRPGRGLPQVSLAHALVTSWPLLAVAEQRGPAIAAVRDRMVRPAELAAALHTLTHLPGRAALAELVGLLAAGCESELEIWGHLRVFTGPGLNHGVRQRLVRTPERNYRLDLAYEAEQVAVELDGERYHSTREQRERDRRRDAALAALGWLTLRFSHRRLHRDPAGCRRDTLATLATRRRQRSER